MRFCGYPEPTIPDTPKPAALNSLHQPTSEDALQVLLKVPPFSGLPEAVLDGIIQSSSISDYAVGAVLLRQNELPSSVLLILSGEVRLLVADPIQADLNTMRKGTAGELFGWSSLLRSAGCESVTASTNVTLLAIPSREFIKLVLSTPQLASSLASTSCDQEAYTVALAASQLQPFREAGWNERLFDLSRQAKATSILPDVPFIPPSDCPDDFQWYLSTEGVPDHPVGSIIRPGTSLHSRPGFRLPYRLIGLPSLSGQSSTRSAPADRPVRLSVTDPIQLDQLGILESTEETDSSRLPISRGHGQLNETMAVLEMLSLYFQVPFRRDLVRKTLEDQFRRDKGLSVELLAGLSEQLGLTTQLADVESQYLTSMDPPALCLLEGVPIIVYRVASHRVQIGHPHHGLLSFTPKELQSQLGHSIRFAIPKRVASTPTSRFGWNWFTPLIVKYRGSLILVFIASLLAQIFGLGIPLLIQQIIDKVLSQGNLKSLNVLGAAMVVMALFQGLLNSLRTYIFVDTTDRMDLSLGSAVINRLLGLPLSYFDKRPVGELSQRLGELNTIRNFMTGTALISILNVLFASLYIVVMLLYSPLLTAVALSIMPLYILLVFGISPLYKHLIRNRAVFQAKTQSHLIEILTGIQTVKAQHFELTARWKWQDRYRNFVDAGFKSSVVGVTSKEIGSFLNQLSGLLVLWFGMGMVLNGELTLGMLIAFRIISGNVTGPLLQLSGLYQSVQNVQLSMERLSDVIDQNPETDLDTDSLYGQIALPPVKGSIRFEHVMFRFKKRGPYQLDDVSLLINPGDFVGIVGTSGSGKSTLMKLLDRLYYPESGSIFIDDYDIAKVDLASLRRQIGVVPQDSLLFEGTISENIALNDPLASDEAIIEAAKIACCHDFIMSLDRGYATMLSERGSNLSGGQRQRLAIARTIMTNPRLLIMDEATSALDYDTERTLCQNLQLWASGRTVLFVTHRLSTIRSANLIVVMHNGRIEETGTHQQLIDLKGRYAVIYQQQEWSS